ncbi:MAG: mandelate racemase/muconate lactonizing enzyme family protein, partial [Candidatus Bathyarchaeia archaeon]
DNERVLWLKLQNIKYYSVRGRHWPKFPWVFVEVETDEGIKGFGEVLPYRSSGVIESLELIKKKLVGRDPTQIESLWEEMFREGLATPAISGVEIALWDALGKSLNTPIHTLLGGRCRDRIAVYLDGFFRGAKYVEEEYVARALDAVNRGFRALKMDVDEPIPSGHSLNRTLTLKDLRYTVQMVRAVREAVGDDVQLAIDCHGAFNVNTAINLAKKLEPFNLMWIEDPVPHHNLRAMAKVARNTAIPVCTGELLSTRYEFRELFELQAAEIIMPDVARTGGILELKKISAAADTYYIPVAPHNMVGPLATMASVQVCACIPNFLTLEFQDGDVPWRDSIVNVPVPIRDGEIEVPNGPGLGVSLNTQELEKYTVS